PPPPRRRRSCPPPSACGPRRSWPTYYAPAPMSPPLHRPRPVVPRSTVIDPIVNSLFTPRSTLVAPMVLSDNTAVGSSFDGSRFPPPPRPHSLLNLCHPRPVNAYPP